MSAEAEALCGAEYGQAFQGSGELRQRLPAPALRYPCRHPRRRYFRSCAKGVTFPDWLLEGRCRAEAALTSVVATGYLLGVSTRGMGKLVESLGITGLSTSQVSSMAR